jgi:hypothetical protein
VTKTLDQLRAEYGDRLAGLVSRGFCLAYQSKDEAALGASIRKALADAHKLLADIHASMNHPAPASGNGKPAGRPPASSSRSDPDGS